MITSHSPSSLLLAILEGFLDGILVLTTEKQLLYINNPAHRWCQRLLDRHAMSAVPAEIWQVCEALFESYELQPEKCFVMESEIKHAEMTLRVRVQWLMLEGFEQPCVLVRLQDQCQSLQTLAIADAQTWHLTERESQVWVLRRSGLRRKQIAAKLYISEDTVKKHLGNIRTKRQSYLDEAEWQQDQARSRYSA